MFGLGGGLSGFVTIGPPAELFDFGVGDQFTFTSCNLSGPDGPTIAQMQSHYNGSYGYGWYSSTDFLDTATDATNSQKVDGVQMMTIPVSGTYLLTLQAPRTKYQGSPQRKGAKLAVEVNLIKEEKIYVVVGQQGGVGTYNGGGSGGTFVFKLQDISNDSSPFELIAAAGGAGGQGPNNSSNSNARTDASLSSNGNSGTDNDGTTEGTSGGSSGSAGSASSYEHAAAPGAGWLTTTRVTRTTSCSYSQNISSGLGLLSSIVGGKRTVLQTSFTGGYGQNSSNDDLTGGFGGAGGGSGACGSSGSGGGGGYSGGGVGTNCCDSAGGGGGTYINTTIATTTVNPTLFDEINGYMTIRRTA